MTTTLPQPEPMVNWQVPAARLGLSYRQFLSVIRSNRIPHYRINARVLRFRMSEVEAWIASRRIGSKTHRAL